MQRCDLPTIYSGQDLVSLSVDATATSTTTDRDGRDLMLLSGRSHSLSSWSTSSDNGTVSGASDISEDHVWGHQSNTRLSKATSGLLFAEPSQTLIFLDWDDTLFPTSALLDRWGLPAWIDGCEKRDWKGKAKHDKTLPESLHAPLEQWREALYQFLCTACSLSDRCVIVTNATRPWVDGCINRFAPNLRPLFDRETGGPTVVYADEALRAAQEERRQYYRPQSSDDGCCFQFFRRVLGRKAASKNPSMHQTVDLYTAGKSAAMRREASRFYSQYLGQTWKNVLSMGDMRYERDAVMGLPSHRGDLPRERLRIKAFTHPDRPGLREVTLALDLSRLLLPVYVAYDGNLDLDLRALPEMLRKIADGLEVPVLAQLSPLLCKSLRQQEAEVTEELLDEVALAVHDILSSPK
mmetsp:Transcript_56635/g.134914  ORF Transcript_56635/g.134914 Transcript_56635/m.134914 type:complete len:409 (+) Transcript_56635:65-1291(+)